MKGTKPAIKVVRAFEKELGFFWVPGIKDPKISTYFTFQKHLTWY